MKKTKKLGETNMDLITKKLAEIGSGKFFKAKEGKNYIRILPPLNDSGLFYYEAMVHYGFKKKGKSITVGFQGDDSPIMKFLKEMEEDGKEGEKLARRLAPRTKFYANVVDRASGKIVIWAFSRKTLSTILSAMADPDVGDITDPEKGHDVVVERRGQKLETEYEIRVRPKPSPLGDEIDIEKAFNLEEVVEELDEEEQEELIDENFGSGVKSSAADEDGEEEPKKKGKKEEDEEEEEDESPKLKKKPSNGEEEEEEEDNDEEEEDNDEEEEEAPRKKKKEVDVDEEDEEEEEEPRRKKKRSSSETKSKKSRRYHRV